MQKISYFLLACGPFFFLMGSPINADDDDRRRYYRSDRYDEESGENDTWFGPGYYYGTWFDDEDDYWGWRQNHRDYPPNRGYYNRDHPVEYHPEGERGDEGERRDDDRDARGGRGGGGRR